MTSTFVSESEIRVRYAETDAMGVVYHTHYIVWFEVGRADYLRKLGHEYAKVEQAGRYLPVSEVGARYLSSAHYDDTLIVRTTVEELRSRSITFHYEIVHASTGQKLVTGFTRHVCVDSQGRVTPLPNEVRQLAAAAQLGQDTQSS